MYILSFSCLLLPILVDSAVVRVTHRIDPNRVTPVLLLGLRCHHILETGYFLRRAQVSASSWDIDFMITCTSFSMVIVAAMALGLLPSASPSNTYLLNAQRFLQMSICFYYEQKAQLLLFFFLLTVGRHDEYHLAPYHMSVHISYLIIEE
ncbi:hypothetical protein GGR53DRAFT_493136 [Hypoxylon sp. FL1150]|nr:hypothetical protein GGR53DRAFT_493136 [Hypoxylon sp. FL1150]